MNTSPPDYSKAVIALLLLTTIALSSKAAQLRQGGCAVELIAFSPCLPYVSSPPNNETSSVSSQCCDVFSSAFESAGGECLCYLLRQPLILGFPLNATKLLELSSLCPPGNATSARNTSLEFFCLGLAALPPLQGTIDPGPGRRPPSASDPTPAESPSPMPILPAETTGQIPKLASSPSSSSIKLGKMGIIRIWFQQGITVVLLALELSSSCNHLTGINFL